MFVHKNILSYFEKSHTEFNKLIDKFQYEESVRIYGYFIGTEFEYYKEEICDSSGFAEIGEIDMLFNSHLPVEA